MYRNVCVLAVALALLAVGAALASDPIGGYLLVDKVVLHPTDSPTTVQIWGSFSLATRPGGKAYSDPQRGYLYYKAPSGKEVVCRKEWNDLSKAAGTNQVIGFGSSYDLQDLGTVRKAGTKLGAPDTYPVAMGLVKVGAESGRTPVRQLLELPGPQTPAEGERVPPGNVTLVVRNIADRRHPDARYVFELESASGTKETGTVAAGQKETRWAPEMKLKAGEKYTWRVRATDGTWKGPVVTSSFAVKGGR